MPPPTIPGERRISKVYRAIVCGRVAGEEGLIEASIDGRPAATRWRVTCPNPNPNPNLNNARPQPSP